MNNYTENNANNSTNASANNGQNAQSATPKTAKNGKRRKNGWENIEDTPLSKDFYLKYAKQVFFVIILLSFYINLRYECEQAIYNIDKAKRELNDARYTSIQLWGTLTSKNKPEIVKNKVKENNVDLQINDEPVIVIDK